MIRSVVIGKSSYGVQLPNRSIFAADKVITIILIVQHPKVNRTMIHPCTGGEIIQTPQISTEFFPLKEWRGINIIYC